MTSDASRKRFEVDIEVLALVAGLRAARSFLGVSQKHISEETNISLPTLNRLERLERFPRYSTILKLTRYFREIGIHLVYTEGDGFYLNVEQRVLEGIKRRIEKGEPITARAGLFKDRGKNEPNG